MYTRPGFSLPYPGRTGVAIATGDRIYGVRVRIGVYDYAESYTGNRGLAVYNNNTI